MGNLALKVEGLGKQYRIGKQERYKAFRDVLVDAMTAPVRRAIGLLRGNAAAAANLTETIWALRDVSFEVKHGEVVGIIGRNGAGKSTLLKILSRITEPTTGYADVYGRVGALLEVGTGFHPELTGRENIYLNGAILGMTRDEIRRKFDEIVAFAGVEKFIDTPVKHYSSGMGLRLGFAVAAHLEPEILVVDEVLAVGDAEFQKKCMGKMSEVAGQGRTVLFVSHNMAAVRSICRRGILLNAGMVEIDSEVSKVVKRYLDTGVITGLSNSLHTVQRVGGDIAKFEEVAITTPHDSSRVPKTGDDIEISVLFRCSRQVQSVVVCVVVWDSSGARIIDVNTGMKGIYLNLIADEHYAVKFRLKRVLLRPAIYTIELYMGIEHQQAIDYVSEAIRFEVKPDFESTFGVVDYPGSYRCEFDVEVTQLEKQNKVIAT